jgi:hypothetical protein
MESTENQGFGCILVCNMFLKVTVKVSISRFSGLYYSSDGGTSWKNSDATLNTIRFINTAIAAGQNKMIRK